MVICVLADLSMTCVLPKTFPSPITRDINLVETLASANRHFWCRAMSANLVVRLRSVNNNLFLSIPWSCSRPRF
jgi:hypothetical protein